MTFKRQHAQLIVNDIECSSIDSIEGTATASNYSSPPHTIWNNIIFALMEMLEVTFSFTKRMTRK